MDHSNNQPAAVSYGGQIGEGVSKPAAKIALLTGGGDRHYALGLAGILLSKGVELDFIGSDENEAPELFENPKCHFFNLWGNAMKDATRWQKVVRICAYYVRLIHYAVITDAQTFHVLWNNKFVFFDRTLLMIYYRLLGKKIVFTAHNVNAGIRDGNDSFLNRLTLKIQYRLCNRIFVHTEMMKAELASQFNVTDEKVCVITHGINIGVPNTVLTPGEARRKLGIKEGDKTLLFYGNIAPYKGLEYLVSAFIELSRESSAFRMIIAGRTKKCEDYWLRLQRMIESGGVAGRVIRQIEYITDEQTEIYFKAADVLILPYTYIYQSGVLFLGYSFGLPVIAADVGSLREEIIEGKTGFVFRPQDASDLVKTIKQYFASDLYRDLDMRRQTIREYANDHYSWAKAGEITKRVYSDLSAK